MLPLDTYELARVIHAERIQHANRPRPEWTSFSAVAPRGSGPKHALSLSVAHILRRMAARLDPGGATVWT
jgi:hypothetical protein